MFSIGAFKCRNESGKFIRDQIVDRSASPGIEIGFVDDGLVEGIKYLFEVGLDLFSLHKDIG